MRQSAISFKSGGFDLEGVFGVPDEQPGPTAGVVVCHPHPLRGGNMDNPVVLAIYLAIIGQGLAALRFNFRGVGNSQGVHAEGKEEPADVKEAIDVLRALPGVDRRRIGLAGYSFGAGMILGGLRRYRACKAFALVSPPPRWFQDSPISRDKRPKLFVSGDRDQVAPSSEVQGFALSLPQPVECQLVEGADHFWGLHVDDAASRVATFFADRLK